MCCENVSEIKVAPVSERRQRIYRVPASWGAVRATLMLEIESERQVSKCCICGKGVSSYYSLTDCEDGTEVIVGKGCFKKCARIEGVE